jgi:hypothetical protein
MVGPKGIRKVGLLGEERAKPKNDRAFREKGEDVFVEVYDCTLVGGGIASRVFHEDPDLHGLR